MLSMHLVNVHLGVPILEKELAGFPLQSSLPLISGREGFSLQSLTRHPNNDQNAAYNGRKFNS